MKHGQNNGTLALLWRPCTSPRQLFVVCAVSSVGPPPPRLLDPGGVSVTPPPSLPASHVCLSDTHLLTHTHTHAELFVSRRSTCRLKRQEELLRRISK